MRHLRQKTTFRAHGRQVVLVKKPVERAEHVLMKALLWALYLPAYPEAAVEVSIGDRYKPDVVQLGARGRPAFWAEAGKVGKDKIASLLRRFPETHFAIGKWAAPLAPFERLVRAGMNGTTRRAPFDLLAFPADADRFVLDDGTVTVTFDDVERIRLGG
jgi:hypothetical protein